MTASITMIGLPDAGKSTYLAALFHLLKPPATADFSLRSLPDDRPYLIGLEERFLALKPVGHSPHNRPHDVTLPLSTPDGPIDLRIPDVAGEEFRDRWERGEASAEVNELLTTATGFLLFVRADDVTTPQLIDVGGKPDALGESKAIAWNPRKAPTQAKLVDLLEQLRHVKGTLPPVAVVVSAWDTVPDATMSPADWLRWRVPLLSQWLTYTSPSVDWGAFAIHAQGGSLDDPAERTVLTSQTIVERTGGLDALLAPIQWLLDAQ